MEVVGITGYAQHGKDTAGQRLVEAHGFTRYAFADGVREMALAIDPFVGSIVGADPPEYIRLSEVVDKLGWENAKASTEVRRLLQVIGTEAVRDMLGEDSWVNALQRKAESDGATRIVVTDVRFPNEAEWVHAMGGTLWRVQRVNPDGSPFDNGTGANAAHPSEANVPLLPFDRLIVNDSTPRFLDNIDAAAKALVFGEVGVRPSSPYAVTYINTATGRTRTEPLQYHEAETAAEPVPELEPTRVVLTRDVQMVDAGDGYLTPKAVPGSERIRVEWAGDDGDESIERPATVTVVGPTTAYEVEAEAQYDGDWPRYGYRRIDKMRDDEHLDAMRRHYR